MNRRNQDIKKQEEETKRQRAEFKMTTMLRGKKYPSGDQSINQCQITGCIVAKTMIFWWQKKITSLWKRKIRARWQDERMEVGGGLTSVSGEWWRSRQWRHRPAGVNTVSPPAVCLQSHWQTDDLTTRRAPLFIKPAVIFLDCSHNLGQKHSGCLAEM